MTGMATETKNLSAIIGTIIGTAVAMTTILTTSLGGRMISLDARMGNIENELRAVRAEVHAELREEIQSTRAELREDIRLVDARVRTVETGFARVDQRLEILERAIIPSAESPQ